MGYDAFRGPQADIVERLQLQQARTFISSFDRPNIRYQLVEKKDATTQLMRFIRDEHTHSAGHDAGIVYCQSRRRVEEVAEMLNTAGLNALPYHAGMDAAKRQQHQDRFLREEGLIMVTLAEASDCRRVRLLAYFGEKSEPCGNCDNCLHPPALFDATESARKLLSCIYRVQQTSGTAFGAGHIMDILRGKQTDKMAQYGHDKLSTFGIGADLSETQWRALLRQLIAIEAVQVDAAHYNTLHLADAAREILKGQRPVALKLATEKTPGRTSRSKTARSSAAAAAPDGQPLSLNERDCLATLKAWRGEVAREHNLPAFVIFHDSTLRAIASRMPHTDADLEGIAGLGQKKREAYGAEVLRVVRAFG